MHRFEEIYNVPWRYNKKFCCDIKKMEKIVKYSEIKFCSSKKVPLKYDYYPFIKEIEKSNRFVNLIIKILNFNLLK